MKGGGATEHNSLVLSFSMLCLYIAIEKTFLGLFSCSYKGYSYTLLSCRNYQTQQECFWDLSFQAKSSISTLC